MQSIRATELSKAEGLMRVERSNKDLHMQRLRLEKAEERQTFIEVAQTVVATVSSRISAYLRDPEAVAKTVGACKLSPPPLRSRAAALGVSAAGVLRTDGRVCRHRCHSFCRLSWG